MKFMYPAVFRKNEDGTYNGYFPDLECCTSTGDTLDEAIENANEAAYNWITVELDEEEPNLPSISDPSDLNLTPEDIVRIISVNIRFYDPQNIKTDRYCISHHTDTPVGSLFPVFSPS